jgi:prolyl-tRNA synthetase
MMAKREFDYDKKKDFSAWYNAIIYAADMADIRYNVQGFIVHKPWSMTAIKKMYSLFEEQLEERGHQPCLFPTVILEDNFEREKEHAEGFAPEVFWITHRGDEQLSRRLALRPTSEAAIYPLYALWVKSKSDLPLKLYQSCSVFRNESETNPFLRGREFLWIEAHDAFASQQEARAQLRSDVEVAVEVIARQLCIPLMVFKRPQWDKFAGAVDTFAFDTRMPDGKAFQISTTHDLGQNFSKAFGITFADEAGEKREAWQTTFGIGIWRILGAVIAVHGDNKGLCWPWPIAPLQVVIIPIFKGDSKAVMEYAESIAADLDEAGVRCRVDAGDKTPGFKYNFWEMKGVPLRIEVGERETREETITLCRRDNGVKTTVKRSELLKAVLELAFLYQESLRERAQREFQQAIQQASSVEETKKVLDGGGYARIFFCSTQMDGKPCADILQSETRGGKVRGTLFPQEEKVPQNAKCLVCGKHAEHVVYVARQY